MTYQSLAFFTGLFGSLHCVAMCGPLVMAIPFRGNQWHIVFQKVLYQLGRILTYSLLGFLIGSFGKLFNLLGWQQAISLVSGIILLVAGALIFDRYLNILPRSLTSRLRNKHGFTQKIINPFARFLGRWMSRPYGGIAAGALHGLIPCGMVYLALAGSLNSGSAIAGAEFMFCFGLGTTPLLVLSSVVPMLLKRFRISRLMVPALMVISGAFLILRAANADIPYISSPVRPAQAAEICR